jgi:tetratricopeptide (TPR) repeat protein
LCDEEDTPKLARMSIARSVRFALLALVPSIVTSLELASALGEQSTTSSQSSDAKPALDETLRRADALLKDFDETEKPESLDSAMALIETAAKTNPRDYGVSWRRARANQIVGLVAKKDDDKLTAFERAIEAGKTAIELRPDAVEGHYWLGTSYGCYGETKGMLKALSSIGDIRDEMRAAIKIDPKYDDGGAYVVLGKIDFELPGWMGGDSKRAIEEYERGLALVPKGALLKLYLSDSYYDAGRRDDAKRLLDELLALKLGEHSSRDQRRAQREAKEMYAKRFAKQKGRSENY